MQSAMKGLCAVVLLAATSASKLRGSTNLGHRCPEVEVVDPEMEVLLPHNDCDKFYQCIHGVPLEMSCPKNLFYSIIAGVCEWRDSVDCEGRNIPEKKVSETTLPSDNEQTEKPEFPLGEFLPNGCPVNPNVPLLLPHESGCKFFYYCERGEKELKRCPTGLYFNKKHQICDWPWKVTCRTSPKQQKLLNRPEEYFRLDIDR